MTIWIAAALFLGLGAALGVSLGAIRASVMLVGAFFGAILAMPLGSILRPLIPKIGLPHPFWSWTLPPIIFFVVMVLVFIGLGFAAHRPVDLYYKYKVDDYHRRKWERLNQRLGIAPGMLTGLISFIVLGVFVYVVGYSTLTFSSEGEEPMSIRLVNSLRADMPASGFDRLIAPLDPAPAKYYTIIDTLGFVYHNLPKSRERIANYPPLYALAERSDIQDFLNDKEFQDSLDRKMPFVNLVNNPRTLGFINTPDLAESLLKNIDLKDFRAYLESGKSSNYDTYNILGRWDLDAEQVIIQTKKSRPDITSSEMGTLKKVLSTLASGTFFKAFYDNKFMLVMNGDLGNLEQLKQAVLAAEAAAQATNAAAANPNPDAAAADSFAYDYRRRYGASMRSAPPEGAPAAAAPPPPKIEAKTLQGTWEGEGDSYMIKLQDDKGKSVEMTTRIQADEIVLSLSGQKLVFVKQ